MPDLLMRVYVLKMAWSVAGGFSLGWATASGDGARTSYFIKTGLALGISPGIYIFGLHLFYQRVLSEVSQNKSLGLQTPFSVNAAGYVGR